MVYYIFISHSWKYSKQYNNLLNLLKQNEEFNFQDYSISEEKALEIDGKTEKERDKELEQGIESKMKLCSVVLFIKGVHASYSKWMPKELEIAKNLGKKIITIDPWGAQYLKNVRLTLF